MENKSSSEQIQRRHFITKSCALGASICFGCSNFFSFVNAQGSNTFKSNQDKYSQNSGMSYEQVFNFAYRDLIIPQLIEVSHSIGREKFIEILKTATDKVYSRPEIMNRFWGNLPEQFSNIVLDLEVIQDSSEARIFKITKCLWAKTFREAEAADIGYAIFCYGDYAAAKSNDELLQRETTLMQGHECCILKWTKMG